MQRKKRNRTLLLLDGLALLGLIVTFSPLVTPAHKSHPMIYGIPYTLGAGLLMGLFFIVLAYWVSLANKEDGDAH